MAWQTRTIAITADTPTQIAGPTLTGSTHVRTSSRSLSLKLNFIPTSTAAVVQVAHTSAGASTGFPIPYTDPANDNVFLGSDDIDLVADDTLWLYATEAGTLYVSINGL